MAVDVVPKGTDGHIQHIRQGSEVVPARTPERLSLGHTFIRQGAFSPERFACSLRSTPTSKVAL
jgi:hypothetical protein